MTDLVEEGLAYFDRVGDDGDRLYVAAIRQEIDKLRKDAERYRWLRENAGAWEVSRDCGEWTRCETGEKFKPRVYFTAFGSVYGGMCLDDAIDAAQRLIEPHGGAD